MQTADSKKQSLFQRFLATESAGGFLLMGSAVLALVVANSPLAPIYFGTLSTKVVGISVLHWINDALMVLFFLLVGLEIKRELLIGQLRHWPDRVLPGIAAAGGMVVPAAIFALLNRGDDIALRGWAIPAATDIAFALGVLSLFGSRVPVSLKVFLTALAILDDLGAILIIALFYTAALSAPMALAALAVFVVLAGMNRMGVKWLPAYLGLGVLLWFFVLKSGIHATVAGVLLAMTIPLSSKAGADAEVTDETSALHRLEHGLAPWSGLLVLPVFGFANAGVSMAGLSNYVFDPVTLGVALGLLIGKQAGIFGSVWLCITARWAEKPRNAGYGQIYAISLLCGIGFTMSLFIGELAYQGMEQQMNATKIGVLAGSLLAALAGGIVLGLSRTKTQRDSISA